MGMYSNKVLLILGRLCVLPYSYEFLLDTNFIDVSYMFFYKRFLSYPLLCMNFVT